MKFARNEDGTIAILFAIAAIPVVLITGLAVDYATWTSAQRKMQGVGDAAALAGAKILSQSGATSSAAQSSALSMVQASSSPFS